MRSSHLPWIASLSPDTLRDGGEHVVSGLNNLGVHFIGALCRNELGYFFDWIDIRVFEISLFHTREADLTRHADDRGSRSFGLPIEIAADRLQSRLIGKISERQLAKKLQLGLILDTGKNFTAFVDDNIRRLLGNCDGGLHDIAIDGHDLAISAFVERAGSRIKQLPIGIGDLEPAPAV